MWLITEHGMYSVSKDWDDDLRVYVKARRRKYLEHLQEINPRLKSGKPVTGIQIEHTPEQDYPYRTTIPHTLWQVLAAILAQDIDYEKFKQRVEDQYGAAHPYNQFLLDTWAAALNFDERRTEMEVIGSEERSPL